jgi:NAD+ kinase
MLAPGASGMVLTPLAPHGGVCPPLATGPLTRIRVTLDPGHGGARVELDGQVHGTLEPRQPVAFTLRLEEAFATLVSLGDHESMIAGLRRRGILLDSPRVLARDSRTAGAQERPRS